MSRLAITVILTIEPSINFTPLGLTDFASVQIDSSRITPPPRPFRHANHMIDRITTKRYVHFICCYRYHFSTGMANDHHVCSGVIVMTNVRKLIRSNKRGPSIAESINIPVSQAVRTEFGLYMSWYTPAVDSQVLRTYPKFWACTILKGGPVCAE